MFYRVTAILFALAWLPAGVIGQEKEDPIASQVKAGLKDLNSPFTMVVLVKVKEGMEEKFETAFAKAIVGTRKEKGNIRYDLNQDTKLTTRYMVYERWTNYAALEAHLKTEHIRTLLADIGDVLAAPPEVRVLLPAGETR